ncbi:LLM class F420-dependent oxidoreductase [Pedobacter yulinensis]|uniref:LLM class F420-dependent oxidoreductase n=1 Tax=Pedobacter yulinensis TaxID=2126353 RepID=A0A2T3HI49_9SPHI|nr:TIGR03885 family FMN-dependent LLM class oxidoreductase [Pedobacter yulinensis]PST82073.1 LLM class F420-dependent oxidoreductase [Pedobacter yulinensis]
MTQLAYHASHEQFSPSELRDLAILAEEAGFDAIASSDHFHPWSERQGHSGLSFAWLGAAMQLTTLPFSMVCAPGQRYHPAIVAQALATLCEMFPGRLDVALGSGEAINESITGQQWPDKTVRNRRLLDCATVIRRLLAGETVSHAGLVTVQDARLYTLPSQQPRLFCAALSEETARWAATWADGLLTAHQPFPAMQAVVAAFRENGGKDKPIHLKVQLSYAPTSAEALDGAHDQWRTNILPPSLLADLASPEQFDAAGAFVRKEDMYEMVRISSNTEEHIDWLKQDLTLGFERIILHNVNRNQRAFIEAFGQAVIPALHSA